MPNNRTSLKNPRAHAFKNQQGLCYYCQYPMWNGDHQSFMRATGVRKKQLPLVQCTGEHLLPHSEGGSASRSNIVAACAHCNMTRHRRKKPPTPEQYRARVEAKVQQGRWLTCRFFNGVDQRLRE